MKNILYLLSFLFVFSLNAQKNKNGTIYDKHPGIDLISAFHKAYVSGDVETASEILHDDVKYYDGNEMNKDAIGGDKQSVLNNISWISNYFDYASMKDTEGAYPDMLEYKKSGNWVQSWFNIYGVHKVTGVELDHPVLRVYRLNDDSSKITAIIEYSNKLNFRQIGDARTDMKNGVIYMSHENINSVRKAMYAFLNGDAEKAYSFFHENSTFHDINEEKVMSFDQIKARDAKIFSNWTMTALDESGYPDYLEYDWRDSNTVQSWWNMRMTRNSDGKEVVLKVLFLDDFDNDGKIIRRFLYWNGSLLK
tara:strand:+ start:92 stop:1012 length:921 start_codon:yes stop_codon:yes gene_type:complete